MKHIVTILLCCVVFAVNNYAQNITVLSDSLKVYIPRKSLQYYEDLNGFDTIESIASDSIDSRFKTVKTFPPNFSATKSVYWFKIKIMDTSSTKNEWLLEISFALLNNVRFYFKDSSGAFEYVQTGNLFSFSRRPVPTNKFVFPLRLTKGSVNLFYIRVETETTMFVPIRIIERITFESSENDSFLFYGFYFGTFIALGFYNFFLWIVIKDRSYIYYVLYLACVGFYQFFYDGLTAKFIIQDVSIMSNKLMFLLPTVGLSIFGALFARNFLQREKYLGRFSEVLKYFSLMGLGIIALCLFQSMFFTNQIIILYAFAWLILSLTAGLIALYKKYKPATYFLAALSALVLGVIIRGTKAFFPEHSFLQFDYAFQLGVMIEAIILSLALGNRIKQVEIENKLEKEKIQNRIARDLHDELGSDLSSISLISKMARENKSIDQQTSGRLKKISDAADHSVNSIREIIWLIDTENVIFGKLIDQIKVLTAGIGEDISIRFSAENVTRDMELNVHITRNLYLSIKEIFNNINKHSNASNVEIDISNKTNSIKISIIDDGDGFEMDEFRPGHGLKNIELRISELNGDCLINSVVGKGTQIEIKIPL